jgi:hypothetical protein
VKSDVIARQFRQRLIVLPLAVLAYAVVLDFVYTTYIVPEFGYVGYRFIEPPFEVSVLSWLVACLAGLVLPWAAARPSGLLLWVLYIVVVAPTILTLPYMGSLSPFDGLAAGAGLGAAFLLASVIVHRRSAPSTASSGASKTTFRIVVLLFSVVTYGYIALTTGIDLSFLSLTDVYDQRADYREALAEATLLGYLVSNQANVINPILIARGVQSRNWTGVAAVALGQFILYTATGFKTVLFSMLAIVAVLLFFKAAKGHKLILFLWGATALLVVTWIVDRGTASGLFSSLFARRFLFTPARLSGLYFDWYSHNPLSLLANSILRPFIDSPYEYGPARTIAIYATGSPEASLNANVFASGFAEFGWAGVFGVAVLLGVYLRILDRSASGVPLWIAAAATVMPAVTLSNTALHTAMLSHGLVAAVVMLLLVPRPREQEPGMVDDARPNRLPSRSFARRA